MLQVHHLSQFQLCHPRSFRGTELQLFGSLYRYYKVTMSYNGASYEKAMLHVISFSVNALPGYDPTV